MNENLRFEWLFLEYKLIELLLYPFYSDRAHVLIILLYVRIKRLVNGIKIQPFLCLFYKINWHKLV